MGRKLSENGLGIGPGLDNDDSVGRRRRNWRPPRFGGEALSRCKTVRWRLRRPQLQQQSNRTSGGSGQRFDPVHPLRALYSSGFPIRIPAFFFSFVMEKDANFEVRSANLQNFLNPVCYIQQDSLFPL